MSLCFMMTRTNFTRFIGIKKLFNPNIKQTKEVVG